MNHQTLKGKKVIVTGGAGFIGSHLCEALVEAQADVVSIDNYSAGKAVNIDFLNDYDNFTALNRDVCDEDLDAVFDGAHTVFHQAASKKNICLDDPKRDLAVNAEGTLNLLQLALKYGVKKFVHGSTGSVYGEPTLFPSAEDHPLRPVSYYGVSKLAGERYVDVFHRLHGLDTTILRYFHVYGPRQESNAFGGVVSIFLRNLIEKKPLVIFGDGHQVRSFTYVKDLVEVNLRAATYPQATGQVYNAASGIQVSILELAERMRSMMGHPPESIIQHGPDLIGDIRHFDIANKAIIRDLGVHFEQDFWGTLAHTLDDYLAYFAKAI